MIIRMEEELLFSNSSIKNLNSYFDENSIILNIEKFNDNYIKEYNLDLQAQF